MMNKQEFLDKLEKGLCGLPQNDIKERLILTVKVNAIAGLAMLGAGIACAGLSIFLFFGCIEITKGLIFLTKKMILGIKSIFIGRRM